MTDDVHITRTGDDYSEAFQALLPLGQAWPRALESAQTQVVIGLTKIWGDFEVLASLLLEQESDPRTTMPPQGNQGGLLPDWERNWGLPDPCYPDPVDVGERQRMLVARMTMLGAQSRAFFIQVAHDVGYTITISEYRTFVVGIDRVGDARVYGTGVTSDEPMRNEWGRPIMDDDGDEPVQNGQLSEWPYYGLGPETTRFYWTVHVDTPKLTWFRCSASECGINYHLEIGLADDLECVIERWKPAHTDVIFDYSGLSNPGDPLAGTP